MSRSRRSSGYSPPTGAAMTIRLSNSGRRSCATGGTPSIPVLGLCERAGLVRLGTVAIDGTKVRANASKERFAPVAEAANLLAEAEARDVAEEQLDPGRQDALRGASGAGAPAERRARFDQAAESLTDDERPTPRAASPQAAWPKSNKAKGRRLAAERRISPIPTAAL